MQLDLNFNALTRLSEWWSKVKSNFEIIQTECTETRAIADNACTPEQAEEYLAELVNSNSEYMSAITAFKNLYEESGDSTAALEEIFGERVSMTEYNTHKNNTNIHHTHTNKSALDTLTDEKMAKWDSKSDVVFGVYTGDGTEERTINLGFKPTAVVVYNDEGRQHSTPSGSSTFGYGGLALDGYPCDAGNGSVIEICNTGFKIGYTNSFKCSNYKNTTYYFIAYKNGEIMVIE